MPFEILLSSIKDLITAFLQPQVLILVVIAIAVVLKRNKDYKDGAYYKITKLPYSEVRKDVGRFGEYLIYVCLKKFEKSGAKFLFNVYIPKADGETTEIDVLMITSKGLFVFESKNYSGWIFGSEGQKNWYQTLPEGRGKSHKEHFYNPIMQNRSHIKHLKALIGEDVPMNSIVVFSKRCTLKSVDVKSSDVKVAKRDDIYSIVSDMCNKFSGELLTTNEVKEIYNKLYVYSQADEQTKTKHIADIQGKITPKTETVVQEISEEQPTVVEEEKDPIQQIPLETNDEEKICPKCGGKLILKTATRGANTGKQFYGCSNFPKCRYILSGNEKEL